MFPDRHSQRGGAIVGRHPTNLLPTQAERWQLYGTSRKEGVRPIRFAYMKRASMLLVLKISVSSERSLGHENFIVTSGNEHPRSHLHHPQSGIAKRGPRGSITVYVCSCVCTCARTYAHVKMKGSPLPRLAHSTPPRVLARLATPVLTLTRPTSPLKKGLAWVGIDKVAYRKVYVPYSRQ